MQYTLLANLKLSERNTEAGHTNCGVSEMFPGYYYQVSSAGLSAINRECMDANVESLFGSDPGAWMLGTLAAPNITVFERMLFMGFNDMRNILARMILLSDDVGDVSDSDVMWFERMAPLEQSPLMVPEPEEQPELPFIDDNELLTFADYDAMVYLIKTKQYDKETRRLFLSSLLNTMVATEADALMNFDDVNDVLYAQLIIAIQSMKYVHPEQARKFMSFVTKTFIMKERRGE